MKQCRTVTSIYEESAAFKFAASPVRPPNLEKVTIPFLIDRKGKFIGRKFT
jgi:hypothetical protein